MQHSLHAEGYGIRLRPVRMEDAPFIVWLRNQGYVRGRVGDSAKDLASQEAWLREYFSRENDYYFIAETLGGIAFGTHGLYNFRGSSAEKGRHIMRDEVLAGVPAGMLATELAFNKLGLTELRSCCVSTNTAVRSLHLKTGFKQVGISRSAQLIDGKPVDLLDFIITLEDWLKVRETLLPLTKLAMIQITEWEKTQLNRRQPWEAG